MNADPNPVTHKLTIIPNVGSGRYKTTGDCSCGYGYPLCDSSGRVGELHRQHIKDMRDAS